MRFVLALTAFALAALQAVPAAAQFPWQSGAIDPTFNTRADGLDSWCAQVKLPSSIALCSDAELRALAVERQHAFDAARLRLNPDQQKALLADQNSWVRTYPQACGLSPNVAPSLPLAPAIKICMAQAGAARVAYLREYGGAQTPEALAPPATVAPAGATEQPAAPETSVSPPVARSDESSDEGYDRIYAIFNCYVAGANNYCQHVTGDPRKPLFLGKSFFESSEECQQYLDAHFPNRERRAGAPKFICMSKTVPVWEPTH